MRRLVLFSLCAVVLFALGSSGAMAQAQIFTSSGLEYTLELPSATWRALARPDGAHQHTEFIYGDRSDGLLRIRKEVVESGMTAPDLARRDQERMWLYAPGYVEGREERFVGRLNGVVLSYEYTAGGKPMAGRIYYLQADNRTIYALHFTGERDKLLRIRNQTDAIARSFHLK